MNESDRPQQCSLNQEGIAFLEALLSQCKTICASQQTSINTLPCLFQAAFPELKGFDSCGFQSLLWTSPRKSVAESALPIPVLASN